MAFQSSPLIRTRLNRTLKGDIVWHCGCTASTQRRWGGRNRMSNWLAKNGVQQRLKCCWVIIKVTMVLRG